MLTLYRIDVSALFSKLVLLCTQIPMPRCHRFLYKHPVPTKMKGLYASELSNQHKANCLQSQRILSVIDSFVLIIIKGHLHGQDLHSKPALMAVAKSSPRTLRFTRPKVMRPVRAVRLVNYDPLNRFVAAANIDPDPRSCLYAQVPEDQIMCEFFVTVVEVGFILFLRAGKHPDHEFQGMIAPVYLLSLAAYDPRAGETETIRLARFTGFPGNADAPLWTRRLPPRKLLHFSQPRAFVARLVGGMTDISVKPTFSVSLYYCISDFSRSLLGVISATSIPHLHHPLRCSLGHDVLPYVFPTLIGLMNNHTHLDWNSCQQASCSSLPERCAC